MVQITFQENPVETVGELAPFHCRFSGRLNLAEITG